MVLGDILYGIFIAMINTFFTTGIFSVINNIVGIPFRLAGV